MKLKTILHPFKWWLIRKKETLISFMWHWAKRGVAIVTAIVTKL